MLMEYSRRGFHLDLKEVYSGDSRKDFSCFLEVKARLESKDLGLLTIDLSPVPEEKKLDYMAVSIGLFVEHNLKYTGIDKSLVESADWGRHRSRAVESVED